MEAKALTDYQTPNYPTKKEVLEQPGLMKRCENERWRKLFGAGVSGVLLTGISLAGFDELIQISIAKSGGDTNAVQDINSSQKTKSTKRAKVPFLMAPIFEHGDGRAALGCVVISPPAFISEEDALIIIKEELAKNGVILNKEKVTIKDVNVTPGKLAGFLRPTSSNLQYEQFVMDLQDPNKAISVEFISFKDYHLYDEEWNGLTPRSTVQEYDFKKAANELRRRLNTGNKEGIYGIFYDPAVIIDFRALPDTNIPPEKRWEKKKEKSENTAREMLREQVRDFAKWLKKKKAI
jgi:hypothetical protein